MYTKKQKHKDTYNTIKVLATPVKYLLQSGMVFILALTLAYQGRIGSEYDTFPNIAVLLGINLDVSKLHGGSKRIEKTMLQQFSV